MTRDPAEPPAQDDPRPWVATNSAGWPAPAALAVDAVLLTVRRGDAGPRLEVLLLEAGGAPDGAGTHVLPGGLVPRDRDTLTTATDVLERKTGLRQAYLEQLAAFTDPGRDPRGWIPTIAYLGLVPPATEPTDPAAAWHPALDLPPLGYDHREIVAAALDRVSGKLWWSNVAVGILPGSFTLAQARDVYEAIAAVRGEGVRYDPSTFARDLRATDLIEPTGEEVRQARGRPASLWRFKDSGLAWGAGRRKRVAG